MDPQYERLVRLIDLQKKALFSDQILFATIRYRPPQDPMDPDENGEPAPEMDPYSYETIPLGDQKILIGLINDEINRMKL